MDIRASFHRSNGFSLNVALSGMQNAGFIGVTGPSGVGKSTLLRILAGLERDARVSGRWGALHLCHCRVGLVFQDSLLFPHLTVEQNLQLARSYAQSSTYSLEDVAQGCECSELLHRTPLSLSGGEAQRVALARAIINHPDILLLDEPVSALDWTTKHRILRYLKSLSHQGMKVVMVSHDLRELALYCDHAVYIEKGEVKAQGKPEAVLLDCQQHLLVYEQQFSVLSGPLMDSSPAGCVAFSCEGQTLYATHPLIESGMARILVDARDVSLDRQGEHVSSIVNALRCKITDIGEVADGRVLISLSCEKSRLTALISQLSLNRLALSVGETLTARFKLN